MPPCLVALLAAACAGEDRPPHHHRAPGRHHGDHRHDVAGAGVEVLEVFDGDTLLVSLEGAEEEVRLLGINAPEHDECFGDEAREALAGRLVAGPLRLDIQEDRDQFGRLLAYAYAGESLLNLALVAEASPSPCRTTTRWRPSSSRPTSAPSTAAWACGPPTPAAPLRRPR